MAIEWDNAKMLANKNMYDLARVNMIEAIKENKIKRADTGAWEAAQVGVEYIRPNQEGGIHGIVYRQYFTDALPEGLTAGDNVSDLINFAIIYDDTANRSVARGNTDDGTQSAHIVLSGAVDGAAGNLTLAVGGTSVLHSGWVDYCKNTA